MLYKSKMIIMSSVMIALHLDKLVEVISGPFMSQTLSVIT